MGQKLRRLASAPGVSLGAATWLIGEFRARPVRPYRLSPHRWGEHGTDAEVIGVVGDTRDSRPMRCLFFIMHARYKKE